MGKLAYVCWRTAVYLRFVVLNPKLDLGSLFVCFNAKKGNRLID